MFFRTNGRRFSDASRVNSMAPMWIAFSACAHDFVTLNKKAGMRFVLATIARYRRSLVPFCRLPETFFRKVRLATIRRCYYRSGQRGDA